MTDPDRMGMWPVGVADDLPDGAWAKGDLGAIDDDNPLIDPLAGLASLGFLRAALRRRRKLWVSLTAIGLLIGCGLFVGLKSPYQAATTIILVDGPNQNPQYQIFSDISLAQSTAVASAAIAQLKLDESPAQLIGSMSVTAPTISTLQITASATDSAEAVSRATAIGAAYLKVRAQYATIQEQEAETALNDQLKQAQQKAATANAALSHATSTGETGAALATAKANQAAAGTALSQVQQQVPESILTLRTQTKAEIQNSQVINAAVPLKHTHTKTLLYEVGGGLFGGLIIGVGIIVISALISDKLRRRDDIAQTIGCPVGLSVGPLRAGRLPALGKQSGNIERDMGRVVDYLSSLLPVRGQRPATLGVVAVDDQESAAKAVVGVATARARHGGRILLADLSKGRHLARLLDSAEPGIRKVSSGDSTFMLVVPEADDIAPCGPLPSKKAGADVVASESLLSAGRACDVVLTLVSLDPALGGDYLSTWAANAVVMVTAGVSPAARIRAAGEMVSLSGTRLRSVVLAAADSTDDSLGAWGLTASGRSF